MNGKKLTWHKIAEHINEIQFGKNNTGIVEVKRKKICIAKFRDNIFAVAHTCPHAGGMLADGYIDGPGNIVCPVHGYRYDLKNGRNSSGEGYYLKNWPVEIRKDGVYLGMEESSTYWSLF